MSENSEDRVADGSTPYTGWPAEVRKPPDAQGKQKRKRRKLPHTPMLSITSLTDCVTLLLVYLLKTFSTSPIEVTEPSINLPVSSSKENIEESTVLMITGPASRTVVGNRSVVIDAIPRIVVDGKPVLELDAKTYRIRDSDKQNGYLVLPLLQALKKAKEMQEITKEIGGKEFTGKVVILADSKTPYRVLTDLLVTCGSAGFGDFRFAVIRLPD